MKEIERIIKEHENKYGYTPNKKGIAKAIEQHIIKARVKEAEFLLKVEFDTAEHRLYIAELKKELKNEI